MSGFEVLDVIELDVLLELVDAHFEISNQKQSEWWSYLEVIQIVHDLSKKWGDEA